MNLVVDIGNTVTKIGLFAGRKLRKYTEVQTEEELLGFLSRIKYNRVLVSSVRSEYEPALKKVLGETILFLNRHTPLPIRNCYQTPDTLGYDRIAAAVGAALLYPKQNRLVIDAGTCITYEFIDQFDSYWGGGISPGTDMRLKALNNFTSKLPHVEKTSRIPLTGRSTRACIVSGTLGGIIGEVNYMIDLYRKAYPDLAIILCGGDARFFEKKLKGPIFVYPKLVLTGLNGILEHYALSTL